MALTKPASYDMIVINESAFIATILSHTLYGPVAMTTAATTSERKSTGKKLRKAKQKDPNAQLRIYTQAQAEAKKYEF